MINVDYDRIIKFAISITIFVFVLILINDSCYFADLTLDNICSALGKTITICGVLFTLFVKYFWKGKIFRFLVPIPYLGGKWIGILRYCYEGKSYEKQIEASIKQDLFHLQILIKTNESESKSCCASFNIDEFRGERELFYTYMNIPNIKERTHSVIHYGSSKLSIIEENTKLRGCYWTDRQSIGEIELNKN